MPGLNPRRRRRGGGAEESEESEEERRRKGWKSERASTAAPNSSSSSSSSSSSPFLPVVESAHAPVTTATPSMSTPAGPLWSNSGEKAEERGGGAELDDDDEEEEGKESNERSSLSTWKLVGRRAKLRARGTNLGSLMPPFRSRRVERPESNDATTGDHSFRASGGRLLSSRSRSTPMVDDGDDDDDGNDSGVLLKARGTNFFAINGV